MGARIPFGARLRFLLLAIGICLGTFDRAGLAGSSPTRATLDLEGRPVDPLSAAQTRLFKATVLVFVRPDCPISNRYAPDIAHLQAKYGPDGVAFWLVYPDGDLAPEEIRKHISEFNYPCSVVRDPGHRLVDFCHARVTPEAAVVTAQGQLAYHGRIDDRYLALGKWRAEANQRDLELALDAVLHGKTVSPGQPAVGCSIPAAE